ncbi:PDR/VanB family oxidoreductase [Microbacterium sp. Bi128]|uniref:PDR/VanB family oxidoreductase n=1 Tax=Microbacterium sp. Bi128 TaxID=2821115 RepID=UPI001DAE019D|nr:PDR/VanB family oxidoreductase [Microbacterium sp. Bi128]CAH0157311.1 Phenoxybenzoate dioxygenase subunit beta [Microbacterium sp. Bi128]
MTTREDAAELRARVRSLTLETPDVMSVELEGVDGPLPAWTPGAHVDLEIPGAPVRQYSLCGDPGSGRYRIAVLHEEQSRGGSRAVHERLRPGDAVSLRGPRTHFGLEPADEYLFVAGGIGITPVLPMVRAAAAAEVPWRVLYLGASRTRMAFLDDLATIPGGTIDVIARDEGVRADLAAELAAHPNAAVYACGPARMLEEITQLVPEASGRLHREYFTAPVVEYAPGGPFSVRLALTGVELTVEPEQSVLDVMRSAGVDVLSDCEEGICGSCETGVLEGEVEHRDFVLTTQERAANDCMMVCVSRSACPLLVLQA